MKSALVRLAVLLLIAVVMVAAWAVWFRAGDQPAVAPPSSRLYAAEQDFITSLALRTEDGSAAFVRRDGVWYFTDAPLLPVNLDRWGGVVLLLSGPGVDRLLPEPGTPADFGLDVPTTIRIGLADGSEIGVSLGSKTPDERYYYAQVEGRQGVALVNAPWGDVLRRLVTDPPRPYWHYRIDPVLVRLFEVESAEGIVTFLLGLADTDDKPSARIVTADSARDLDAAERTAVLDVVGGPGAFSLRSWPDGSSPADLGLKPPRAIIRLSYELADPLDDKTVESAVYVIGGAAPGGGYYAATADSPSLIVIDEAWVTEALGLMRLAAG